MARTVIVDALVFDGNYLHRDLIVVIENDLIVGVSSFEVSDANIIDGKGSTLLPGSIDAHVHLDTDPQKGAYLD
jgi:imidazolonepropionase-like amidohydrolase